MSKSKIKGGHAEVYVGLNKSGLERGLREVRRALGKASQRIAALGGAMAGVGAAITGAFVPAISAASDFEETFSKFQTVFGDNADAVKTWSDQFATEIGRSKTQVVDFMASSQDLFVPLGFDAATAEELSKTLTGLSIDLASFNNMADADALNDLHAALTGSGEVMKKYGVIVSEAAVKQELVNQAIDPKAATETQKVQARLNIILAGTTAAQGDAIRTSASFANQMKRLRGTMQDMLTTIGQAVLPTVTKFVTKVNEIASYVSTWTQRNQDLIGRVFMIGVALTTAGTAIVAFGTAIAAVTVAVAALSTSIVTLGSIASVVFTPIGGVLLAVGAAATIVAGGIAFIAYQSGALGVAWTQLKAFAIDLADTVMNAFAGIRDALAAGEYQLATEILWAAIKSTFWAGIESILVATRQMYVKLVLMAKDFFVGWVQMSTDAAVAVAKAVQDPFNVGRIAADFAIGLANVMNDIENAGGIEGWARKQREAAGAELQAAVDKAAMLRKELDDASEPKTDQQKQDAMPVPNSDELEKTEKRIAELKETIGSLPNLSVPDVGSPSTVGDDPSLGIATRGSKAALDAIARSRDARPRLFQQAAVARGAVAQAVDLPNRLNAGVGRNDAANMRTLEQINREQLGELRQMPELLRTIADNTDADQGEDI